MDCITDGLLKAMDSLTENNRWGSNESTGPDELLDSTDWRLIEIQHFRKRIEVAESITIYKLERAIKAELKKFNFSDEIKKALFLKQMGMSNRMIAEILGKKRNWFSNTCSKYLPRTGYKPRTELSVILANIREHEKKVGIDG